jgi:hydrogenase nickel incorporation protein HypA/HybF
MHELSVTESVLEIALRHARDANAKKITRLYLVIGQLASIVDDSVQFYWDIISKDTLAEGAALQFKRLPAKLACRDCDHQYIPDDTSFSCPNCHSDRVKIISGEEFYMEAIDIES